MFPSQHSEIPTRRNHHERSFGTRDRFTGAQSGTGFVASPKDVADERAIAFKVLKKLRQDPLVEGRPYPWGVNWENQNANTKESKLGRVTAVGLYPQAASPFGVHDLSGNLWEWCSDTYEDTDRRVGRDKPRVVKGGAWTTGSNDASTLPRARDLPDFRGYDDHGVRVCRAN